MEKYERSWNSSTITAAEIHQPLSSVDGKERMSVQHIRKQVCDFSNGGEINDLTQVAWPSIAQTSDAIAGVCPLLKDDHPYTVQQLRY